MSALDIEVGVESASPNASFSSCPWDVLFTILCHVQVLDLIALRRTSRLLGEISRTRALWAERLRMLVRDEIMVPISMLGDLDDPNMDISRLERIVTTHVRSPVTLLERDALPSPSRVLRNTFAVPPTFAKVLPLGRFLVTGSLDAPDDAFTSTLCLWDLDAENALVSSLPFTKPLLQCTFVSTPDSRALILAVVSGSRFIRFDIDLIEICWPEDRSGSPSMHKLAALAAIPVWPQRLAIEDDTVAFGARNSMIFWNWKKGMLMSAARVSLDDAPPLAVILRPPYMLLSNGTDGLLNAYALPTTQSSLLSLASRTSGHPATFDTSTIQGWRPSSCCPATHFVTGALGSEYGSCDLRVYEWAQAHPSDPYTPSTSASSSSSTSPDVSRPSTPSTPDLSPKLMANMTIPSVDHLDSIIIHRLERYFLAICPPDIEKGHPDIQIRVTGGREGGVRSGTMRLCDELAREWTPKCKLMMCPFRGSLVATTETSIMVFDF